MGRIRTIKPELPQSESMGRVSRNARLLFIQLWTLCDDEGRLRGNSRVLASLLYPYDDGEDGHEKTTASDIDAWLGELDNEGCLIRYSVDGNTYIQICKWLIHQKIDHASKSKIPEPDESSRVLAKYSVTLAPDQGPRIKDQGPRKGKERVNHASDSELFQGIDEQVISDFKALRKAKKAPITETAIREIAKEAEKAGLTLEGAMRICCSKGWQGFNADWVKPKSQGSPQASDKFQVSNRDHSSTQKAMEESMKRHNIVVQDGEIEF